MQVKLASSIVVMVLLMCGFIEHVDSFGGTLGTVLDVVMVGKDIVIGLGKAWNIVDDHIDFAEAPKPFVGRTEQKLIRKVDFIQRQLLQLNAQIDSVGAQTISSFLKTLPDEIKLELRLNDLLDYLTRVNVFYKTMRSYVNTTENLERHTLEDFASTVVSHDGGSIRSLVERIHAFVAPQGNGITNGGILGLISRTMKVYGFFKNNLENKLETNRPKPSRREPRRRDISFTYASRFVCAKILSKADNWKVKEPGEKK